MNDDHFATKLTAMQRVVRKIDLRITVLACVMLMALELDRSNIRTCCQSNMLKVSDHV